jgi:hypothetical protein
MPCKHEGGTDVCDRDAGGNCRVNIRRYNEDRRAESGPPQRASSSNAGAAREHRVVAVLLEAGYCVHHNSAPNSPFDVLATRDGDKLLRIEVRAAQTRRSDGIWCHKKRVEDRCDYYAAVTRDGRVFFYPPLPCGLAEAK